jgi:hypothetical protein
MSNDLNEFFAMITGEDQYTPEQKRDAKDQIGKTMANLVIAKTMASMIAKSAATITEGAEGDKSIMRRCELFAADCESKLARIAEGWDHNPTDTTFSHSRERLLQGLAGVRDSAVQILALTNAMISAFKSVEENQ